MTCLNTWGTVDIKLDGSSGNRLQVGTPYINRVTQVSFGIISQSLTPDSGEFWVNNLRTINSNVRSGVARRADAAFVLGNNFATINTRYREVDSGFSEIDQTSTHFQHSTQLGADFTSSGVSIFSQPLVTQASVTRQDLYTGSRSRRQSLTLFHFPTAVSITPREASAIPRTWDPASAG